MRRYVCIFYLPGRGEVCCSGAAAQLHRLCGQATLGVLGTNKLCPVLVWLVPHLQARCCPTCSLACGARWCGACVMPVRCLDALCLGKRGHVDV